MAVSYELGGDKVSLSAPTGYAGPSRRKQGRKDGFSSSQKVMDARYVLVGPPSSRVAFTENANLSDLPMLDFLCGRFCIRLEDEILIILIAR